MAQAAMSELASRRSEAMNDITDLTKISIRHSPVELLAEIFQSSYWTTPQLRPCS